MSDKALRGLAERACPSCGSCSGMFTANSMNCLAEVIGLALPGNGTIPAAAWVDDHSTETKLNPDRLDLVRSAGHLLKDCLEKNIRPLDVITEQAARQRLHARHGHGRLHQHRPARSGAGPLGGRRVTISTASIASQPARPTSARSRPRRPDVHIQDVHNRGGIGAILKEIATNTDCGVDLNARTLWGKLEDMTRGSARAGRRRDPAASERLLERWRPGRPVRQSRAEGLRRQGGRRRRGHAHLRRARADLRIAGRGAERHPRAAR